MFDGLHHAREHLSLEQTLAILHWLTDGYGTDQRITDIVDTREIWIVFAVNPDGAEYDLTGSPYRAWRKNRQPNAGSTAIGTDINRNYGYHWACCGGSSSIEVLVDLPRLEGVLDPRGARHPRLHGQPADRRPPADQDRHHVPHRRRADPVAVRLHQDRRPGRHDRATTTPRSWRSARKMAATNGYTPMQSSSLYVTDGDEIDWAYGNEHIFMYTFEMYPSHAQVSSTTRFYPPDEVIAAQTERNREAILMLIEAAGCPYALTGKASRELRSAVRRLRDLRRLEDEPARHRHRHGRCLAAREPGRDRAPEGHDDVRVATRS